MNKIKNIEEAISLFVDNAKEHAISSMTGNYKKGNKCFDNKMKCLSFLYKEHKLELLQVYLTHKDVGVRESTAYALLNYFPAECERVLSEIAQGGYGIISFNADITLSEWKKGNLDFPFIDCG